MILWSVFINGRKKIREGKKGKFETLLYGKRKGKKFYRVATLFFSFNGVVFVAVSDRYPIPSLPWSSHTCREVFYFPYFFHSVLSVYFFFFCLFVSSPHFSYQRNSQSRRKSLKESMKKIYSLIDLRIYDWRCDLFLKMRGWSSIKLLSRNRRRILNHFDADAENTFSWSFKNEVTPGREVFKV